MSRLQIASALKARQRWLTGWAVTLVGLVGVQGSSALASIIVARRAEPLAYGRYLSCYALASLLVVLPGLGLDRWLLARGGAVRGGVGVLWQPAVRVRRIALAAWLAGMALLAAVQISDALPPALLLIAAVGLAGESISALAYAAFRCDGRYGQVTLIQGSAALLLLGLAFAVPAEPDLIVGFALGRTAIALAVAAASYRLAAGRYASAAATPERPGSVSQLLNQALPFSISEIAISIYMRADLSIISMILGSAAAAVYGPALNLINISFLVPFAFNILVLPRLARAHVETPGAFKRLGLAQLLVQSASGTVIALLIWLAAGPVITLTFGPNYAASIDVLRLLSPLVALKAFSFGLGNILTAANQQPRRTVVQVAVALFNALANLLVVRPFGVPGVALVYVSSELLLCVGYGIIIGRTVRRRT